MIEAIINYQFMKNALITCFLASIICGIIGVLITEKKLVMLSGGIAHTAYGGVGLGYLINIEPIIGALIFSVGAAIGIGYINKKGRVQSDIIVGMLWSLGMALGILFVGLRPGYPPDMSSYLFGNILSVTMNNLYLIIGLTFIIVMAVASMFEIWKAYLFDEEFCTVMGIKTTILDYTLLILVAITVVALIRVAGIILVLAMLTAPAASSALFTRNLKSRIFMAIGFGIVYCLSGLTLSYYLNIASGACIVIISVTVYFIMFLIMKAIRNKKIKGIGEN